MGRVLLLEDDRDKASLVEDALFAAGCTESDVVTVADIAAARRELQIQPFDLWVLDLLVPARFPRGVIRTGGLDVLKVVLANPVKYQVPPHIVALSSFDDVAGEARDELIELGVGVLRYEPRADAPWCAHLRSLLQRIGTRASDRRAVDLVLLATVDVERTALLRVFPELSLMKDVGDVQAWTGVIAFGDAPFRIGALCSPQMGMPAAAVTAARANELFAPRAMLMGGIAAGVRTKVELGDVLVSDPCWDAGSGKLVDGGVLEPDPRQERIEVRLRNLIERVAGEEAFLTAIHRAWPAKKPRPVPRVQIGPTASSAAVVADAEVVRGLKDHARKIIGLEMEAYGVMHAAARARGGRGVPCASIKAVCDYADSLKADDMQEYAAEVSFRVIRRVAELLAVASAEE